MIVCSFLQKINTNANIYVYYHKQSNNLSSKVGNGGKVQCFKIYFIIFSYSFRLKVS